MTEKVYVDRAARRMLAVNTDPLSVGMEHARYCRNIGMSPRAALETIGIEDAPIGPNDWSRVAFEFAWAWSGLKMAEYRRAA